MSKPNLPLNGLVVLEFSQYLAGPSAGLRLADFGARVIKIERPKGGDACRKLAIKNLWVDDSSLLFHTINRDKESFVADLKNSGDLELIKELVKKADVMTHNFRPGVMDKLGLSYDLVKRLNPRIIYGEITGYGTIGEWKDKPGQDLLVQSLSGLTFTTGNAGSMPMPFGLAIADMICGTHLVQGLLAALIRRQKSNEGALIEVSLLESILDFQFELLTTYYNGGGQPERSQVNNGHPLLSAPYGVYKTSDGHIALSMTPISKLQQIFRSESLSAFNEEDVFRKRDEIKKAIADQMLLFPTSVWMKSFTSMNIWAMPIMSWSELINHEAYKVLKMEQELLTANGEQLKTTRCPIRLDGQILKSKKRAPKLGEHTHTISKEVLKLGSE